MSQPGNQLLQKQMTRRQFLVSIGVAAIALIGIPQILRSFGATSDTPGTDSSSYGGHADSAQYRTLR